MRKAISIALAGLAAISAAAGAADDEYTQIFDGKSTAGWKTNTGKPLPAANVQTDGLNPHDSGEYLVVYEKPMGDFVLDFEYKLSKGCNSGVFLRVGDLKDPVMTGIEIALDDTKGQGLHDSGAFYDLVAPRGNPPKPAGEWNFMRIIAKGPKITVALNLNGHAVSTIDLDEWDQPGSADGSNHKFKGITVKNLPRSGYFGFQDHGRDCWFRNVRVKSLD